MTATHSPALSQTALSQTDLLRVENLTVKLGKGHAPALIDDISLSLKAGETLGLVGESGSGKTTLGMSLMRLLTPRLDKQTTGRILYDGQDIRQLRTRDLSAIRGAEISMILQDPMASLNPVLSVGEQLKEGLRRSAVAGGSLQERAVSALEGVRIPSPAARLAAFPHQLSGGMRQRVVGAIALSRAPRLLIADEPTTSLDVTIQFQFLELLKELQRQSNMAMVFITHDFGVVAKMCDRVAVMYAGQIVEEGPVRQIFHNPRHWYTRALLASVPRLDTMADRLPMIAGNPPPVTDRPAGCRFHPRCVNAQPDCTAMPALRAHADGHLRCHHPHTGDRHA